MSIDSGAIAISEPQIKSQAGKRAVDAALGERDMEEIRCIRLRGAPRRGAMPGARPQAVGKRQLLHSITKTMPQQVAQV
ncbi:hypothetical protein D3C72_1294900 [compost metagenome]